MEMSKQTRPTMRLRRAASYSERLTHDRSRGCYTARMERWKIQLFCLLYVLMLVGIVGLKLALHHEPTSPQTAEHPLHVR
jgi:hypothetical protein